MTLDVLERRLSRGEYPEIVTDEQRAGMRILASHATAPCIVADEDGLERDGTPTTFRVMDEAGEHIVVYTDDVKRDRCLCGRAKHLRGAPCRHLYAVTYNVRPPRWDSAGSAPPATAAKPMARAAAEADLPQYLTQRAGDYSASLVYAEEHFYPLLHLVLDDRFGRAIESKKVGRPRKADAAVFAAMFVRVRDKKSFRQTPIGFGRIQETI